MPSSINASTTAGLVNTADTSGVLQLQTAGTTAISIDASQAVSFTNSPTVTGGTANGVAYLNGSKVLTTGSALVFDGTNLGVGVTPSAWGGTGQVALQIGTGTSGTANFAGGGTKTLISSNQYYNGSVNKYINNGYAQAMVLDTDSSFSWIQAASGTAGNTASFFTKMTLDASGNLLVGTTSANPSAHHVLQYSDTAKFAAAVVNSSASTSALGLYIQYTALAPNSSASEFLYCGDTIGQKMSVKSNGGIYNFSANDSNLSDRREKTNFAPSKSYLDVICAIPVQTFNYIDQNLEEDDGLTLGVVAQDVQAVAPELVTETNWAGKDEEPKMRLSIYQTDLQYALMKCIQEQQILITQLTARITALENK